MSVARCLRWSLDHAHDPIAYDNLSEGNVLGMAPSSSRRLAYHDQPN